MRIPAISNAFLYNKNGNKQEQSKSQNLTFQAVTVNELKSFPLEKKLTHMFTSMTSSDLVGIGKNAKEIFEGLRRTIKSYDHIIKRVLFVKDEEIENPLIFSSYNMNGIIQCFNVGKTPVVVDSENRIDQLLPDETMNILDGDVICGRDISLPIKAIADLSGYINEPKDMITLMNAENYANEVFDMSEIQRQWVDRANVRGVETVLKTLSGEDAVKDKKLTFKDVAGINDILETLKEDVIFPIEYAYAHDFTEINRGFIFYGGPGTGKTLTAEALAGEVDATVFKIAATELETAYYGKTEEAWRTLFAKARANQPSIILIDEMDSVMKERGKGFDNQHRDGIVNQILTLMTNLENSEDQVFVIGTTNKVELLDKAIRRSGRFGKRFEFKKPDINGLREICNQKFKNKKLSSDFDVEQFLPKMLSNGFTGADIKHVVNEAHKNSWRRAGVYDKMKAKTLTPEYMESVFISNEDVYKAISDWEKMQAEKARKPIGYNK